MRSVNKVILVGNLTRDPEIKQTTSGQSIVTFGLATNREWVTSNGEKKSLAEYHNIAAWGSLADICGKFLKKGKLVYIEGYLKTRSWDGPSGVRIFRTEIVATDMIMLDKRPTGEDESDDYSEYLPSDNYPSNHNDSFDPEMNYDDSSENAA
jgi:single-strand DNA-binding protein